MLRVLLLALALSVLPLAWVSAGASETGGGWDNLGTGASPTTPALNGAVFALNAGAPGVLYAGGAFTDAGGNPTADYIASWYGLTWSALGASTLNGAVHSIASAGGKIYVGGAFTNAGGDPNADFLAVWDGVTWAPVCNATGPAINGLVYALQVISPTLYVGGAFQDGAGIPSADYLLACDLPTGAPHSTVTDPVHPFSGALYALSADGDGTLYAGGAFSNLEGNSAADRVAYLQGGVWHPMGSGSGPSGGAVTDFVHSLASSGTDLYVGTDSTDVAGIPQADHVVRWNGSAWSALGSSTGGADGWFPASASIDSLAVSGSRVFAGGTFLNANGEPLADRIAYFDGSAWHPLGSNGAADGPFNGDVSALAAFGTQLIAGGSFTGGGGNSLASFVASRPLFDAPPPPPPAPPPAPPPPPPPPPATPPAPPRPTARCVVPNVKGKTVAAARARLLAQRCALGRITRVYSRKVRKGRVVSQSRRAARRLPVRTRVHLVVSRGRRAR